MTKERSLLETAIFIACKAHEGQSDKGGQPYILHPLRVMNSMTTLDEKIVAVLHDTIEDSDTTISELQKYGFTDLQLRAVELLTKKKETIYQDYLRAIKQNPLAQQVKLADLEDNMNLGRLNEITCADLKRYIKYLKAYQYLHT